MEREEKVKEVGRHLQLTIVLSLFFPVSVQALFIVAGAEQTQASDTILQLGLLVFFLVFNYLLLAWRGAVLSVRSCTYLKWSYLLIIFCYALIFLLLSFTTSTPTDSVEWFAKTFYQLALWGVLVIPVITIFIFFLNPTTKPANIERRWWKKLMVSGLRIFRRRNEDRDK
jgi:hypothetical protein